MSFNLNKYLGHQSSEQQSRRGTDSLLREDAIALSGSVPAVKTFNKKLIIVVSGVLVAAFVMAFFYGLSDSNKSKRPKAEMESAADKNKMQGQAPHLDKVPASYQEAAQQEQKAKAGVQAAKAAESNKENETRGTTPQFSSSYSSSYTPQQYPQIPSRDFGGNDDILANSRAVPRMERARSEFTDAQKAPIRFNLEGNSSGSKAGGNGDNTALAEDSDSDDFGTDDDDDSINPQAGNSKTRNNKTKNSKTRNNNQ